MRQPNRIYICRSFPVSLLSVGFFWRKPYINKLRTEGAQRLPMDSPTKAAFLAMKKVVASRSPAACPAQAPAPAPAAPQSRRRRNQPGNPNPDAEVVALSPGTLMARNRFVCEVCTKGFQREQNLQLHRRGHNLPWKLKQKTTGGAPPRRKVYLCPEPTCVHHAPSRALGDLTGIKKHYSRKHGEKIYRCEKCSKKYAVLSDWKAHMKTCGTREYRCDSCTTLFSRRDSFVTHRAFCDVLAQEIAAARPPLPGSLFSRGNSQLLPHPSLISAAAPPPFRLAHPSLAAPSTSTYRPPMEAPLPSSFFLPETHGQDFHLISGHVTAPLTHTGLLEQLSDLQTHSGGSSSGGTAPAPGMFNLSYFPMASNRSNSGGDSPASSINILQGHHFNNTCSTDFSEGGFSSLLTAPPHPAAAPPHMSATALLQKAAQLGSTSSATSASLLKTFSNPKLENLHHRQLQFSGGGGLFDQDESFKNLFASIQGPPHSYANYMAPGLGNLRRSSSSEHGGSTSSGRINVAEGMTRDFLGMRAPAGSGGGGETSVDRKGGVLPPPKGPAFGGIRFK